ncbi:MAG TPA: M67 family metallopeptidase [Conexibacter sp.]|jgi:proteasome lid subunit RPN8/RPN11
MKIARELYDQIVAHARAEAPNECCGIVSTDDDDRAVKVYPTTNIFASPLRYEIDPEQLLGVWREIDAAGLEMGAVYHSHTRTVPEPSQTDINSATNPQGVYIIVGLADGEPDVRAWNIVDGAVTAAELVVE